jgi:hypothetical protein
LTTDGHAELAKEGIPLPLGNRFWASNWPTGKSPLPGLIIHLIPSVSAKILRCFLVIPILYYNAGNRDYRAATISGLPLHPGRRGLSPTNYQFIYRSCMSHIHYSLFAAYAERLPYP